MREQLSHNSEAPPSVFFIRERGGEDGGGKRARWITEEPRASVSFLFIYSPCLFFFFFPPHLRQHPPPSLFLPPSSTHFHFALFQFSPPPPLLTASFSSLFSSLCLPREKRFCLLLVSAPSQSAFLISSYCFCLIFKCYPRPNGNPYKKKKTSRERGGKRNRLGIVFHSRTLRQSPPCPPQGKIWKVFGGRWGGESWGWRMGPKFNPKGVTYFCVVSWPPALHYNLCISFSFYLPSSDLPLHTPPPHTPHPLSFCSSSPSF